MCFENIWKAIKMNSQSQVCTASERSKTVCPYNKKCYRKNPTHFREMSHPHLEELVEDQLDGEIILPDVLFFECRDRSDLMEQLKVLQMVIRKERDIQLSQSSLSSELTTVSTPSQPKQCRNLFQSSQSPKSPEISTPVKRTVDLTLDSPKKQNSLTPKRSPSSPLEKNSCKKSKDDIPETSNSSTCQSNSRRSSGTSIIEDFTACTNQEDRSRIRNQVRQTVVTMMQASGRKVPHLKPCGEFDIKYAMAAPYFVFLTVVQDSPETWTQPYSITFPEILDISLGQIKKSLHLNFMVDVGWLCLQYVFAGQKTDGLILYGERNDTERLPDSLQIQEITCPTKYGTHHSKISVLQYENGARIIISTANLYEADWENRTQALWMSPHLLYLPEDADEITGESRTGFKGDFISYMKQYRTPKIQEWLRLFERLDFSSIDVFFVASVPGNLQGDARNQWGMKKLGSLLAKHAQLPPDGAKWPIVAQSSSIGSMGPNFDSWLSKEIVPELSSEITKGLRSVPKFQFIYPSINNYIASFDCRVGSCCLPYGLKSHNKQKWFKAYMYQWRSTSKGRDRAMPHVKSYTRISPDSKKIPWAVITSANLSKAAWGFGKNSTSILSYEAGVVFFPKFLTGEETFPIKEAEKSTPPFPIPYDVPLTTYRSDDEPFVVDFLST